MFQVQRIEWSLICNEFFVVKLENFQRFVSDCKYHLLCMGILQVPESGRFLFVFVDVSSFVVNLQNRRDGFFFLCGEVCIFIHKLCSRCHFPDTVPLENSWFLVLGFRRSEGTFLSEDELLVLLNLTDKVTTASKQKTEGLHSGKKPERAAILKTASKTKTTFVTEGLYFVQYVLDEILRQSGLNTEIVKRLAAFDPLVLFKRPTELALRHFDILIPPSCCVHWSLPKLNLLVETSICH